MKKIVIIGGGASGLTAASFIPPNNKVLLLEKRNSCGKKILVTGNGRCNYWNENQDLKYYHSENNEVLGLINTIENRNLVLNFFDSLGIVPYVKNGYYYPYSREASTIRNALLEQVIRNNVEIVNDITVTKIMKNGEKFTIITDKSNIEADCVILATGSLAYYKDNDSNIGYNIAKSFGHTIVKVLPSLVQLKTDQKFVKDWAGVRSDAVVTVLNNGKKLKSEEGEILLTDYGISGICVFNISGLVAKLLDNKEEVTVSINFVSWYKEGNFLSWLEIRDKKVTNITVLEFLEGFLNSKLTKLILKLSNVSNNCYWKDLNVSQKERIVSYIENFNVKITATNSFDKAQVCSGGVKLNEIDPLTMESRKVKDLYIVGEMLDVDGDCGGYNLSFAFMSGMLAGKSVSRND